MAESGENSPPLFIPESWPAMFDQVFLFFTFTVMTFIRYFLVFTFTLTMKTILRRALKILGSVQLLRQSCPHCLWSYKLSKIALRCKKILNRITLMQQITGNIIWTGLDNVSSRNERALGVKASCFSFHGHSYWAVPGERFFLSFTL